MFSHSFRKFTTLTCSAALLSISLLSTAQAHGIYVAQRQSEMVFVFGHGPSDETFLADSFKGAVMYNKKGERSDLTLEYKHGYPVIPKDTNMMMIAGTYDNGYWSEKADGEWVQKPKTEVADAKQAGHYMKYNTTILNADAKAGEVTGAPLEIVPQKNPLSLKPGDTLPIRVYANGKPLAGVEVVAEFVTDRENNVVKTDKAGNAEITIRNNGLNVLATEASEKIENEPKADELGKFATLSFTYHPDH